MNIYLKLSYLTGQQDAFEKVGLQRLPELGRGERQMLEDPDMPEDLRKTELDSYLHRALTAPISSEDEFMTSGKTKGTLGGGALGGAVGGLAGYGLGRLAKHPGKGALIGGLGGASLGALVGRPLGAEAGRREHQSESAQQTSLGDIYTDPHKMQRELHKHQMAGRQKRTEDERSHERNVAHIGAPLPYNVNYNINQ